MIPAALVAAGLGGAGAAMTTVGELAKSVRETKAGLATSLPEYIKSTSIMSRMYVEETLYEEEILLPLIGLLNQLYAGFVFTALQLNQFVAGSRTVRSVLDVVATEADDVESTIQSQLGNTFISTEDAKVVPIEHKEQKLVSGRLIEIQLDLVGGGIEEAKLAQLPLFKDNPNDPPLVADQKKNARDSLRIGKTHESNKGGQRTITLLVQLIPYLLTSKVIGEFLSMNFGTAEGIRYRKMKAGELSYIMDYWFERDLINDRKKALKEDRTGILYEMISHQTNSLSRALMKFAGVLPHHTNIANTIMILDASTFNEVCAKTGHDLANKTVREKFFKESMMMMVVLVDTMYNRVSIYFNGLDNRADYTFKMIQANAGAGSQGNDKYDLKDIMTSLSHGMTPKF